MKYIKKINISMVCLIAFLIRMLIVGASIGDSIVFVAIAGLYGFVYFMSNQDVSWKTEVLEEIDLLKNSITSVKMTANARKTHEKVRDDTKRWF